MRSALRATCYVAGDRELIIIGSQAILGQFPDAPAALRQSMEVDVIPRTRPEQAERLTGALGELSMFHDTHGFYIDGVDIGTAQLPAGWEGRLVAVRGMMTDGNTGWCLEAHDIGASKLSAFRDKDRDYVRVLLVERMISPDVLVRRLRTLPIASAEQERRVLWVQMTAGELVA